MSTVVTSLLALALTEVLDWIDIVSLSLGAIVISALAARRLTWRGKLLVIVGAVTVTGIEWYLLLRPLLD
ncbi:hypothetical protein [Aliagarivorans taiwanensis]|uniref:hypothetical protein n=1 Tax=Aliagarivorans taiwanensis TaxID=561966 RepID=UPI00041491AA|nr:hypothetical protein [Aliagarivorans taiwanensis]